MSSRGHSSKDSKPLISMLESDGWILYKQKGGHRQFKHPFKKGKVTVPQKVTKNIEMSVIKLAGLKKSRRKGV